MSFSFSAVILFGFDSVACRRNVAFNLNENTDLIGVFIFGVQMFRLRFKVRRMHSKVPKVCCMYLLQVPAVIQVYGAIGLQSSVARPNPADLGEFKC